MDKVISKEEVMKELIKSCPSYQTRWEEYVKNNYKTEDEQLLYIDLSDFASYIVDLYRQNKTDEFPEVFEVIELLHTSGDDYVKEAATIGLLEDIQNQLLNYQIDLRNFEQFLKKDSQKWWDNLINFWNGKTKYVGGAEK